MTTMTPQNVFITRADGVTIEVPNMTLATWRSALRAQAEGFSLVRGQSASEVVSDYLGMSESTPVADVLAIVEDLYAQYTAQF